MNAFNKSQFIELIERHKGIIFKVVNSYCPAQEDRQDLAQEIITVVWGAFDKYDPQFKFSTWMYQVALNVAISYYRKDKKHSQNVSLEHDVLQDLIEISDFTLQSDEMKQLYQLISQLDKINKAIILLYLEDESYSDIALSLGISKTNVATRISRIKTILKQQITVSEH